MLKIMALMGMGLRKATSAPPSVENYGFDGALRRFCESKFWTICKCKVKFCEKITVKFFCVFCGVLCKCVKSRDCVNFVFISPDVCLKSGVWGFALLFIFLRLKTL